MAAYKASKLIYGQFNGQKRGARKGKERKGKGKRETDGQFKSPIIKYAYTKAQTNQY